MNQQEQIAINSFKSGSNCAQSVLSAYTDSLNVDTNLLLNISSGFSAGMGRLQETCGAVTGAFMVIGLANGRKKYDNARLKQESMTMIQEFTKEFVQENGTLNCKTLIKCDLNTEEGQDFFERNNLGETICEECISDSINIINKLIIQ
ncbi:MAG: C-GCAxxG-C-C family protein [Bacteroidales bacterium]|jgi:C_GCAxxG_C_C family probable redox protein|nr:C-GCAxxG-C-C family protein [Bacteroidales bacterium]